LKGVSYGREVGPSDPRVLDALLAAVADDPNDNVRLAAIDALAGVAGRPGVQRQLIASFPRQESPLVQIALVDLLAEARGARPRLRPLVDDPEVDPTVRDYLRRRLEPRT
ncbi:MAG: HEAT repeat domain-containing protein, partial [Thermoanaerobaculia bacterium]